MSSYHSQDSSWIHPHNTGSTKTLSNVCQFFGGVVLQMPGQTIAPKITHRNTCTTSSLKSLSNVYKFHLPRRFRLDRYSQRPQKIFPNIYITKDISKDNSKQIFPKATKEISWVLTSGFSRWRYRGLVKLSLLTKTNEKFPRPLGKPRQVGVSPEIVDFLLLFLRESFTSVVQRSCQTVTGIKKKTALNLYQGLRNVGM